MEKTSTNNFNLYFVNGVANENKDGSATTGIIQEIVRNEPAMQSGKAAVLFRYNDAATLDRLVGEIALGFGGILTTGYALKKEEENKGNASTRTVGVLGTACIIGAVWDYGQMQKDIDTIAGNLAKDVSDFLDEDPSNRAGMVLHSQGADVGYRALEQLDDYKDQIRVVTLGAKTTIPNCMGAKVENYKFSNDWVSNVLASPFETARSLSDGEKRNITFINCNKQDII